MAEGGHITLANNTRHDWNLWSDMCWEMNWKFPKTIAAGTCVRVYVERLNIARARGHVSYVTNGLCEKFEIKTNNEHEFVLRIERGHPSRKIVPIKWRPNGEMLFTLGGCHPNYITYDGPTSWMQNSLKFLGERSLREICMPGTKNSGMSIVGTHSPHVSMFSLKSQCVSVGGQLDFGVRYFDIKPVFSAEGFHAGNYTKIKGIFSGGIGQSIESVISDVNAFTAKIKELVILDISQDLNVMDGFKEFEQKEWNLLLAQLMNIKNLFIHPNPMVDLTHLRLGEFIGGKKAAVVVVIRPTQHQIELGKFQNKGIYVAGNFPLCGECSMFHTEQEMNYDQVLKMRNFKFVPNASYFQLHWSLHLTDLQAFSGTKTAMALSEEVNDKIVKILPSCTPECYPSVLYVDGLQSYDLQSVAMTINHQSCKIKT